MFNIAKGSTFNPVVLSQESFTLFIPKRCLAFYSMDGEHPMQGPYEVTKSFGLGLLRQQQAELTIQQVSFKLIILYGP